MGASLPTDPTDDLVADLDGSLLARTKVDLCQMICLRTSMDETQRLVVVLRDHNQSLRHYQLLRILKLILEVLFENLLLEDLFPLLLCILAYCEVVENSPGTNIAICLLITINIGRVLCGCWYLFMTHVVENLKLVFRFR